MTGTPPSMAEGSPQAPGAFHWRSLMRVAAVADAATLLAVAIALRDREALALAALVLLGTGLLRVREGLAGYVLLGLLFADTVFFMATAATSQITHGAPVGDLLIPAAVGGISLAGMLAPLALVVRRLSPQAGRRATWLAVQLGAAYLILTLAGGLLSQRAGRDLARPGDVTINAANTAFSRSSLRAPPGEVAVSMANRDLFWHTFTIDSLGVDMKVPVRGQRRIVFAARPGRYQFYCRIPGHSIAGMKGVLVVGG